MKLKVSQDADLEIGRVFAAMTDFDRFERDIRAHGHQITRVGNWQVAEVGAGWTGRGDFRGRTRRFDAEISVLDGDRVLEIAARIGGLNIVYEMLLVPLGQSATRVNVVLDLRPATLSARLLVQSLKLARNRVLGGMQGRLDAELRRLAVRAG